MLVEGDSLLGYWEGAVPDCVGSGVRRLPPAELLAAGNVYAGIVRRGLALIGAALALGCFAGPAVGATITWSAPGLIDQQLPFEVPEGITDLSCPSVHLCVGTQASGVEISTNPLGGAGAWAITALPVTPGFPLGPISCASPRLCVAVNYRGQVFTSTNPTGGAVAWRGASVGVLGQASALSCPRVRFCIALDGLNVVVSTNPTRPSSWRVINVSSSGPFQSIACPSRKLCVGTVFTGGGGGILTTTSPTGPGWEWKRIDENGRYVNFGASGIACPSTHLCVATDRAGNIFTSTEPARGRWKTGRLPGIGPRDLTGVDLARLSCPSVHLCVSVVGPRTVALSTNPAGGAHTWRTSGPRSTYGTGGLTCASARLCVATLGDLVFSTPYPAGGAATWRSSYLDQGYNPLTAIACPSDQFCVGSDAGGNLVSSGAPGPTAAAWKVAPLAIGGQTFSMSRLSCPSASFCAGIEPTNGPSSEVVLSADPSNRAAWSATALGRPATDVSCPTASFCVVADGHGAVHASSDPLGGPTAWSSEQLGAAPVCDPKYGCLYDGLNAVSCPSTKLCATTDGKYLWTSTDPAAGDAAWAKSTLPSQVQRLYCPTESLCLAASSAALEVTTNPLDPAPQWTAMNLPKIVIPATFGPAFVPYISGLSCVSAQLCVAVDVQGGYAFVGNPADPNSWTATKVDHSSPVPVLNPGSLTGVSCTPSGRCVAADGSGNVVVGTTSG